MNPAEVIVGAGLGVMVFIGAMVLLTNFWATGELVFPKISTKRSRARARAQARIEAAKRAAKIQAHLDVYGALETYSEDDPRGWGAGWDDLDLRELEPETLRIAQTHYAEKIEELTNAEVRARVYRKSLEDLSEKTTAEMERHRAALAEIRDEEEL